MNFSINMAPLEKLRIASDWANLNPDSSSSALYATRIPFPPPPAEALIITGYPIMSASLSAVSISTSPSYPGITETPAPFAMAFDSILSPIALIAFVGGPTNVSPSSATLSANSLFSLKNPYPGCTASAPLSFITEMIFSMLLYVSATLSFPIYAASVANFTYFEFLSASVYTATVSIPNRLQVSITRHAISPLLAINTLLKYFSGSTAFVYLYDRNVFATVLFNKVCFDVLLSSLFIYS
mmetsp:Transcript_7457/g.11041  ORF Transcript_7457/g.11041 Transcript_7457/m.11041 type:complete len:240 (-) Transcript_7457:22-741(-)